MRPFLDDPIHPLLVRHLYVKEGCTIIAAVRLSRRRVMWALQAMESARQAQLLFPGCRGVAYDLETTDEDARDFIGAIQALPRFDDVGDEWDVWRPNHELALASEREPGDLVDVGLLPERFPEDVARDPQIEVGPDSIEIRIRAWAETDLSSSWISPRATWLRMACRYSREEELAAYYMALFEASPEQAREFGLSRGQIRGEKGQGRDPFALLNRGQLARAWRRLASEYPQTAIEYLYNLTSKVLLAAIPRSAFREAWHAAASCSLIWALDSIPRLPDGLRSAILPAEQAQLWREYLDHIYRSDRYALEILLTLGPEGMACIEPVELRPLLESHDAEVRTRAIAVLGQVGQAVRGGRAALR